MDIVIDKEDFLLLLTTGIDKKERKKNTIGKFQLHFFRRRRF